MRRLGLGAALVGAAIMLGACGAAEAIREARRAIGEISSEIQRARANAGTQTPEPETPEPGTETPEPGNTGRAPGPFNPDRTNGGETIVGCCGFASADQRIGDPDRLRAYTLSDDARLSLENWGGSFSGTTSRGLRDGAGFTIQYDDFTWANVEDARDSSVDFRKGTIESSDIPGASLSGANLRTAIAYRGILQHSQFLLMGAGDFYNPFERSYSLVSQSAALSMGDPTQGLATIEGTLWRGRGVSFASVKSDGSPAISQEDSAIDDIDLHDVEATLRLDGNQQRIDLTFQIGDSYKPGGRRSDHTAFGIQSGLSAINVGPADKTEFRNLRVFVHSTSGAVLFHKDDDSSLHATYSEEFSKHPADAVRPAILQYYPLGTIRLDGTGEDRVYNWDLLGAFYGPAGIEIGGTFILDENSGHKYFYAGGSDRFGRRYTSRGFPRVIPFTRHYRGAFGARCEGRNCPTN